MHAMRTRIKVCGITHPADAEACALAGVDAIGLNFYPGSSRYVSIDAARAIAASLPPFLITVALFVDAEQAIVERVLESFPVDLLQFHGDETPEFCEGFGKPFLKAARVRPDTDLLQYASRYGCARGLLLDSYRAGSPGGTGECFDWSLIPPALPLPLVLSGGLRPENVESAVRQVRPWAVDVSSGVEVSRSRKDAALIRAFVESVRNAEV